MTKRLTKHLITLVSISFIVLMMLPARMVHAHSSASDGTITVFFHAEPADRIVAGVPTKLDVAIQDSANRFEAGKPYTCNCNLEITFSQKKIATLPIDNSNSFEPLKYTFPSKGIFLLKVTGTPQAGATFDPFAVDLQVFAHDPSEKVASTTNNSKALGDALPLIALTIITILLITVLVLPKKGAKAKK